jgi:hypothetical protein
MFFLVLIFQLRYNCSLGVPYYTTGSHTMLTWLLTRPLMQDKQESRDTRNRGGNPSRKIHGWPAIPSASILLRSIWWREG